jgi:hypothetical protein
VGDVFLLAVVASLDAGLIAAAVVLLDRPQPARQLAAFLIGCMGLSIAFGIVIVFALHGSRLFRHPDPTVTATIEIVVGGLLIVIAVVAAAGRSVQWKPRRRREDKKRTHHPSLSERAVGHDSVWIAWAAGALYSAPGAYYLAGLALLAKLDDPVAIDVLAIIGFNLVMFTFIELPLIGFLVAPERALALTARFDKWMSRHKRTIVAVVAAVGGIYLLVSGLDALP